MGRKIPGRKHRGVRDLKRQQQERLDKLKDKINAPPVNKDDQEIPKSLARIIELRQKVKAGIIPLKKKVKKVNKKNAPVYFKPSKAGLDQENRPVYLQLPGESDRCFMQKMNKVVHDVIQESKFSEKYKVNIKRNQMTGEVEEVEKREKDPLELFREQIKKDKKESKGKKKKKNRQGENDEQLNKRQKRVRKQKLKKELQCMNQVEDLAEVRHEHIPFGEVAHAPPTLVKPKHVHQTLHSAKPACKELLLKKMLKPRMDQKIAASNTTLNQIPVKFPKTKTEHGVIDMKGKRKCLPVAVRRQLEKQQTEIIKAYKDLKKQKHTK